MYQQHLDALQPQVSTADASTSNAGVDLADGKAVTAQAVVDSSSSEVSTGLQMELQRLEQQLSLEDILLCRSLAELALEKRSSTTGALRICTLCCAYTWSACVPATHDIMSVACLSFLSCCCFCLL